MKKAGIVAIILIALFIGAYMYFSRDISIDMGVSNKKHTTVSGSTDPEITLSQSDSDWNPKVMKTGTASDAGSGVTVTVTTNWPKGRDMNPFEMKKLQKKMQED